MAATESPSEGKLFVNRYRKLFRDDRKWVKELKKQRLQKTLHLDHPPVEYNNTKHKANNSLDKSLLMSWNVSFKGQT